MKVRADGAARAFHVQLENKQDWSLGVAGFGVGFVAGFGADFGTGFGVGCFGADFGTGFGVGFGAGCGAAQALPTFWQRSSSEWHAWSSLQ